MVIIDKTPFREKTGQIGPLGLLQGTLKFGPTWQSRMKAQDVVIAIIEKQLDSNFALLRNITLPNTEINLPLVLIGPPGIYLINVTHERGVYRAKDDEWGTMIADRFVPARINQITRTATFGRVLQTYLDRQGFKNAALVEPILMAADPGMQIESTRPAVRVVMSDALERFAASLSQARSMIDAPLGKSIVRAILVGKPAEAPATTQPEPAPDNFGSSFGSFGFDDENEQQPQPAQKQETQWLENLADQSAPKQAEPQTPAKPKKAAKKRGPLGLTTRQLVTLGITLFLMVCLLAAAIIFVLNFSNV
jgi:hypothetical protein